MKKILAIVMMFVLVLSLAACGSDDAGGETSGTDSATEDASGTDSGTDEGTDAATDSGSAETKTITVWAWDPNFNIAIMEEAKAIYEAENEGVTIEIVDYAKGDVEQKLHTMLASGATDELPDIVLVEDYNSQKYLQSYPGSFLDLTGKIPHEDFASYKVELMTMDGSVYGVPFDSGVSGFFYRTDYLADAGYSAEDLENITWDEFIEIGETVFEKTGHQMLATDPNDGGLMRVMLNGAGTWYFDENGQINIADNEALADSLRIYRDIVESPMTKITSGWGEWVGALNTGDVASITTGVWIMGSVKAEESQSGLWAVAPTPRLNVEGSVNASNLGGSSWYVLSESENPDLAVDFLNRVYTDVDFYQKILVERGAVGSYLPAASGEAYTQPDEFFGGQTVFADFSEWMDQIPPLNYGLYTYEADAAIMGVMPGVYAGESIEEALEMAEQQLSSQIN
jgi:lactose/L-arabinose transport system substrate-binding protein